MSSSDTHITCVTVYLPEWFSACQDHAMMSQTCVLQGVLCCFTIAWNSSKAKKLSKKKKIEKHRKNNMESKTTFAMMLIQTLLWQVVIAGTSWDGQCSTHFQRFTLWTQQIGRSNWKRSNYWWLQICMVSWFSCSMEIAKSWEFIWKNFPLLWNAQRWWNCSV